MSPQNKSKIIGLVVVVLLAAGGIGVAIWLNKTPANTSQVVDTNSETAKTSSASYRDGTYSATGEYISPNGDEKVGITVTLSGNKVNNVSIQTFGSNDQAKQYQNMFKDGISDVVVGKNVNDVSVSRVAGSSLTSTGFNRALETIKQDAKA